MNLIINELTCKDWIKIFKSEDDIDDEADNRPKLKWTKPTLKHMSTVIPNGKKHLTNTPPSFDYVLSTMLFFQLVLLFSWFRLP
jgi:hypothetical protein